jgi:hypothetical protein
VLLGVLGVLLAGPVSGASAIPEEPICASSGSDHSCTFNKATNPDWSVPAGVSSIRVEVIGEAGEAGVEGTGGPVGGFFGNNCVEQHAANGGSAGKGDFVSGTVTGVAGDTLHVTVGASPLVGGAGGSGQRSSGEDITCEPHAPSRGGDGGFGGAASAISSGGKFLVVAAGGGGGGGGGECKCSPGGSGGSAGENGGDGKGALSTGEGGTAGASSGVFGTSGSEGGTGAVTGGGGGGGGGLNGGGGGHKSTVDGGGGGGGGVSLIPSGGKSHLDQLQEPPKIVIYYTIDKTPPVTSIGLSPESPNGTNGWYTEQVGVTVSATDEGGVKETRCVLDPASEPKSFEELPSATCPYLGAGANVSANGAHDLYAASVDNTGNKESVQHSAFKIDQTAPTITAAATSSPNANGWYNGNVVVHFTCKDEAGGSGIPGGACPADETLSSEGSAVSSTARTVTDAAGNVSASSNVVTVSIDKMSPTTTIALSPAAPNGLNGWYTTNVHGTVSASDNVGGSGLDGSIQCVLDPLFFNLLNGRPEWAPTCPYLGGGADIASDGIHRLWALSTDKASNFDIEKVTFQIDKTPPTITAAATSTPNGSNGWYTSNVTVHYTCKDEAGGSGIPTGACPADETLSSEGSSVSSTARTVTDVAGNISASSNVVTVKIDKTGPKVAVTGVAAKQYLFGSVPTPGCETTDEISGVATKAKVTVSGGSGGVGSFTATCSGAVNNAGIHATSVSVSYTVVYGLGAFKSPGNKTTFNKNASIPVQLVLANGSGQPISASTAAALGAAGRVEVTLTGPAITPHSTLCSWEKGPQVFQCNVKAPSGVLTGTSHPYSITAMENVGFGFVTAPAVSPAINPETIFFK